LGRSPTLGFIDSNFCGPAKLLGDQPAFVDLTIRKGPANTVKTAKLVDREVLFVEADHEPISCTRVDLVENCLQDSQR
jgi:hypothetical protein